MHIRRPLGANVSGVFAVYLAQRFESDLARTVEYYRRAGQRDVAAALITGWADLREAADQYLASRTEPEPDDSPIATVTDADRGLSVAEAAAALGVSNRRVRQLLDSGALPGSKIERRWYVPASAVEARARSLVS